jgi:hypothetical protein
VETPKGIPAAKVWRDESGGLPGREKRRYQVLGSIADYMWQLLDFKMPAIGTVKYNPETGNYGASSQGYARGVKVLQDPRAYLLYLTANQNADPSMLISTRLLGLMTAGMPESKIRHNDTE